MRSIYQTLRDPSLHLLAIALILIYLAFGGSSWSRGPAADSPLPYCQKCGYHYMPEKSCGCGFPDKIAQAFR